MMTIIQKPRSWSSKFFWILATGVLMNAPFLEAQQTRNPPRVGVLFIGGKDQPHLQSFRQGLRDLGYIEGKSIVLEYRYAEGKLEKLDELTAELVRDNIDVIVTTAASGAVAARKTTKVIPIVVTSGNLVEVGLAKSPAGT